MEGVIYYENEQTTYEEPEYLYILLETDKYIPTKKQITEVMKHYGVVDKIDYELSSSGYPHGIRVYFDDMDIDYFETSNMLSELKYCGKHEITICFKNSLRTKYVNYIVLTNKNNIFDSNYVMNKPKLKRTRNIHYLSYEEVNNNIHAINNDVRYLDFKVDKLNRKMNEIITN